MRMLLVKKRYNRLKTIIGTVALFWTMDIAVAGVITYGGEGVTDPDYIASFEDAPVGIADYNANGLSLRNNSNGGAAIVSSSSDGCDYGLAGNYLFAGVLASCDWNNNDGDWSLIMVENVSEISWSGFISATVNPVLDFLQNGQEVFSAELTQTNDPGEDPLNYHISGFTFDRINVAGTFGDEGGFGMDSIHLRSSEAVPAPKTIALFGLGLLGLGWLRRRRA